jgi:hypothetical protein
MPSSDIIGDLKETLKVYGFDQTVSIVQGWSNDRGAIEQVKRLLGDEKIGLWAVDGDGQVAPNLTFTVRCLRQEQSSSATTIPAKIPT